MKRSLGVGSALMLLGLTLVAHGCGEEQKPVGRAGPVTPPSLTTAPADTSDTTKAESAPTVKR
jgi:hypothetical protein